MKAAVYDVTLRYPGSPNPTLSCMSHRVTVHEDGTATNDLSWVRGTNQKTIHDPPRVWGIGFAACRILPWVDINE